MIEMFAVFLWDIFSNTLFCSSFSTLTFTSENDYELVILQIQ